jgi:type II secretory pathway pseudopilin PulG
MSDRRAGMTLLEVLIVLSTILILAGAIAVVGKTIRQRADEDLTRSLLEVLNTALQVYYDEHGTFPDPALNLHDVLNGSPNSRKIAEAVSPQLVVNGRYVDSWRTYISYEYPDGTAFPILTSAGPDKNFATSSDNIRNN